MAFDSWYCRHRMTWIFTFRYSYHRDPQSSFALFYPVKICRVFNVQNLSTRPRRPRPREIPNGRMLWFPSWSLDWIGPESEPCSACKKSCTVCTAMHGICVLKRKLTFRLEQLDDLIILYMILIYLKMLSVFLQNEREDATWNFRSQRSHVESIHFMWRFIRFGLHDQAALQPLWRRCHNTLWE